jgi:class 3 adenylate cyclase
MEPRIQYAQTKDGVSIAFWTLGEGMPLIYMPGIPFANAQLAWQIPEYARWFERLAQRWKIVRYDSRGFGMSEREVDDFSLDSFVLDLEAVVDYLGLDRFALFAQGTVGPVAIAHAVRHPQRVSHLLLYDTWARTLDAVSPRLLGLLPLIDSDWETYTETLSHSIMGWSEGEPAHRWAWVIRESVTPETARAILKVQAGFDVTALLPQVRSPTLVLQRREAPMASPDVARRLASKIPNARLALLEGVAGAPALGDTESVLQAIDEFLGEGEEAAAGTELPEGMAVLLFADIVESTALTEKLGDAAFRAKARELDTSLRSIIRESGGTPVEGKVLGDGVLAVFTSARQAIDGALRCEAAGEPMRLQLHIGIHAGDVIREGNNVYGGAVNIAARIAGVAEPGEVLVSDTVRSLGRTSADVTFDDRGKHTLKGVGEPQRLFAVRGGVSS